LLYQLEDIQLILTQRQGHLWRIVDKKHLWLDKAYSPHLLLHGRSRSSSLTHYIQQE